MALGLLNLPFELYTLISLLKLVTTNTYVYLCNAYFWYHMTHFTLISNPNSSVRSKVSFYFNDKIKVQHDQRTLKVMLLLCGNTRIGTCSPSGVL